MFGGSNSKMLAIAASTIGIALSPLAAIASPQCTKEPKNAWLSEAAMKEKIAKMGYREIKVFKTTKTGCYEIYGINADGKKAEVYFNPVDGRVVELNVD